MSLILVGCVVLIFLSILFEFGNRLAARNSILWWLFAGFLIFATSYPEGLRPLADFFEIQVVSNLVIAISILFLTIQLIEQATVNTRNSRKIRMLVSDLAAMEFVKKKRPEFHAAKTKALVVLPCFNEEENLPAIVPQIAAVCSDARIDTLCFDFCFVNDGSRDSSDSLLDKLAASNHATHQVNVGVASALMTGFLVAKKCKYDYVIQCDSDGQHPIEKIPDLLIHAQQNGHDLLIGSRFFLRNSGSIQSTTHLRLIGIVLLRWALTLFGRGSMVLDPTSGFRVYSKNAFMTLLDKMPDEYPEPESIAILSLKGLKVGEYQVTMKPRVAGRSSIYGFGSAQYIVKVITALLALRLRSLFN